MTDPGDDDPTPRPTRLGEDDYAGGEEREGVRFPGCAVWWQRPAVLWPGRSPPGVGGRTVYSHVAEMREHLNNGALGRADDLPARLATCILELRALEARRELRERRREVREAKRQASRARAGVG